MDAEDGVRGSDDREGGEKTLLAPDGEETADGLMGYRKVKRKAVSLSCAYTGTHARTHAHTYWLNCVRVF